MEYRMLDDKDIINLVHLLQSNNVEYLINERKGEFDLIITNKCEIRISSAGEGSFYKSSFCLDNEFIQKDETKVNLNKIRFVLKDDILILEEI